MSSRLELHDVICKTPNVKKVYFQPPSNVKLQYPCIIYKRDGAFKEEADDLTYFFKPRYTITVVDPNPDSQIADYLITHLPLCRVDRNYTADNLHYSSIILYY